MPCLRCTKQEAGARASGSVKSPPQATPQAKGLHQEPVGGRSETRDKRKDAGEKILVHVMHWEWQEGTRLAHLELSILGNKQQKVSNTSFMQRPCSSQSQQSKTIIPLFSFHGIPCHSVKATLHTTWPLPPQTSQPLFFTSST